ncbi:hypothetical protein [Desulfobacter vibrioformis]|uniref:hypothetical protein n=1 Tax=Desulfobacter vibrioformis TaxID=34031 RepID=UPI000550A50B|nr:hypothetical protein [Desulfobacter vibrioformis]
MKTSILLRDNLGSFIAEHEWQMNQNKICPNPAEDWYHIYGKIELISNDNYVLEVSDYMVSLIHHFLLSSIDAIKNGKDYTFDACSYVGTSTFVNKSKMVTIGDVSGKTATFPQGKLIEDFKKMAKSGLTFMSSISLKEDEDMQNMLTHYNQLLK